MNVNKDHLIEIPYSFDFIKAAAIPEAWLTAFQLTCLSEIKKGDKVLIHAAASGVGTALIQLIHNFYQAKSIAIASSEEKLKICDK